MRFSEVLYRLSEKDRGRSFARAWGRMAQVSQAAAQPTVDITNDLEGQIIILTNAVVLGAPGVGQNIAGVSTVAVGPVGSLINITQSLSSAVLAVNVQQSISWAGEVVVPPLGVVRGSAVFNAGAVANVVRLDLFGYAIPLGTLTLS